jgi:hypothetical protein
MYTKLLVPVLALMAPLVASGTEQVVISPAKSNPETGQIGKPSGVMSYPLWKDGCVLVNSVAVDANVVVRVGQVAQTKHGKWKCSRVVLDQVSGNTAAGWVPAN